jgi:hypothetical protein
MDRSGLSNVAHQDLIYQCVHLVCTACAETALYLFLVAARRLILIPETIFVACLGARKPAIPVNDQVLRTS